MNTLKWIQMSSSLKQYCTKTQKAGRGCAGQYKIYYLILFDLSVIIM